MDLVSTAFQRLIIILFLFLLISTVILLFLYNSKNKISVIPMAEEVVEKATGGKIDFGLPVETESKIQNTSISIQHQGNFKDFAREIGLFEKEVKLPGSEYAPAEIPKENLEGTPTKLVITLSADTNYLTTYQGPSLENQYMTRIAAQLFDKGQTLKTTIFVHPLTLNTSNLNDKEFNAVVNAQLMSFLYEMYSTKIVDGSPYDKYFNESLVKYENKELLLKITQTR